MPVQPELHTDFVDALYRIEEDRAKTVEIYTGTGGHFIPVSTSRPSATSPTRRSGVRFLHDERVQILETLLGIGVPVVAARTTPADMLADLAKTAALSDQGNAPLLGRKRDIDKLHMPTM